jgi:hypothetical protein
MCPECGEALNDQKGTKSVFGKSEKAETQSTSQSVVTIVPIVEKEKLTDSVSIQFDTQRSEQQPAEGHNEQSKQPGTSKIASAEKLNTAQEI